MSMRSCCKSGLSGVTMYLFVLAAVWAISALEAAKFSPLVDGITDHKELRKLLRTRTNVLVIYTKTDKGGEAQLKLLSEVAVVVKGLGTIAWVNCGDSDGRKLCKKMKVEPSPESTGVKMLHYKDGTFHTEYTRPVTVKSLVAFLMDPTGHPLWEENPEAKDVRHIETEKVSMLTPLIVKRPAQAFLGGRRMTRGQTLKTGTL